VRGSVCAGDVRLRGRGPRAADFDRRRYRQVRDHKHHDPRASPSRRKIFCPGCEREEIHRGKECEFEKRRFYAGQFDESDD
jgi:hypothetical protein